MSDAVAHVRARLGHPVIDADGHTIEFLPAVRDELHALAGAPAVAQLDAVLNFAQATRALSLEARGILTREADGRSFRVTRAVDGGP